MPIIFLILSNTSSNTFQTFPLIYGSKKLIKAILIRLKISNFVF